MYYDTHLTSDKPRTVQSCISKIPQANFQHSKPPYRPAENKAGRRQCYVCGSYNHISAYHGKPASGGNKTYHANNASSPDNKSKSVNACSAAVEILNKDTQADLLPVSDASVEYELPNLLVTDLSLVLLLRQ